MCACNLKRLSYGVACCNSESIDTIFDDVQSIAKTNKTLLTARIEVRGPHPCGDVDKNGTLWQSGLGTGLGIESLRVRILVSPPVSG